MSSTAILIINWNGGKDTIECLQSFQWPVGDAHFFIIDNASTDQSVEAIRSFLIQGSISFSEYTPHQLKEEITFTRPVNLVLNPFNTGFAAGNNLVLDHLARTGQYRYAWLLNNDTVVNESSLRELVKHLEERPGDAFAGSIILDFYKTGMIQCCGVDHYRYLGVSKLYLKNKQLAEMERSPALLHKPTAYQNGASLLVDISKLRTIGLLDETFFLYSEEADWQIRAAKQGFGNSLCVTSHIRHKGSMSTKGRKHLFFYHYNRSAILFTRKNYGWIAAATSSFGLIIITFIRSAISFRSLLYGFKGLTAGWSTPIKNLDLLKPYLL